jgi:glycerophosphoryl diester phosphodiesterase
MDYMMELAGQPDVPEALDLLAKRHFNRSGRALSAEPQSDQFTRALGALVNCREQGVAEDHPNAWLAELVHQFYAVPQLAADVWSALRYCRQFRMRLAEETTAAHNTPPGERTPRQHALVETMQEHSASKAEAAHISADIFTQRFAVRTFERVLKRDQSHDLIDALANDAELCQPIPPFIERLANHILERRVKEAPKPSMKQEARNAFATLSADVRQHSIKDALKKRSDEKRRLEFEDRIGPVLARSNEVRRLLAEPKTVAEEALRFEIPVPFTLALDAELRQIRTMRQLIGSRQQADGDDMRKLSPHRKAFDDHLVGLAFSGGGVRSATFNLGVLQALASIGVLQQCDYLSTVSGGGYIGGWFSAWIHRTVKTKQDAAPSRTVENARSGLEEVYSRLSPFRHSDPLDIRVRSIRYLREFSNYLTPRTGFLSADTWTMVGIYLRNAVLNQIILASLFLALLLLPRDVIKLWRWIDYAPPNLRTSFVPLAIATLYVAGGCLLVLNLRRLHSPRSEASAGPSPVVTTPLEERMPWYAQPLAVQLGVIVPWLFATSLAAHHFARTGMRIKATGLGWLSTLSQARDHDWRPLGVGVLLGLFVLAVLSLGGALRCWKAPDGSFQKGQKRWGIFIITLTSLVSGGAAGGLTWLVVWLFHYLPWEDGVSVPWHAVSLGAPALMGVLSLVIVVQLGMLGDDFPDEHREWWSRLRSYIHMYSLGWLAWFGVAVYVPWAFHALRDIHWARSSGAGALIAWLLSTLVGVTGGAPASAAGPAHRAEASSRPISAAVLRGVSTVAPYLFVVGLVIGLSLAIDAVYYANFDGSPAVTKYWEFVTSTTTGPSAIALTGAFLGICVLFSWRVDINEFSMHHFYKNRLVRCYLGASRADERKADWFTGFDPQDDIRLAEFDHNSTISRDARHKLQYPGPYPILNTALNLVGGKDLAWQERKAESFVFTPKFCGYDLDSAVFKKSRDLATEAYIPTHCFYRDRSGPLLGMAMAISGAAASANMGRATSPASAFLMTVFNARLGWWIGNTRKKNKAAKPGPRLGLTYTLSELTGSTNDESAFVNLSDGGHFDNLGVYELIRRGCRYVIACDAGQDGRIIGEDLGDLVRRCRTDFNVDIDISIDRIRYNMATGLSRAHCVVGKIHYLNVPRRNSKGILVNDDGRPLGRGDRPAHEVGYLVYLKPSLTGDEPHDIIEYRALVDAFPHEPTSDQWFTETQFEAYRKLGMHIAERAFTRYQNDDTKPVRDIGQLFERMYKLWYPPTPAVVDRSTQHTNTYSEIMERVRRSAGLAGFDHTAFDGLPPGVAKSLKPRDEFYLCTSLIQLMEDVYADLDLEQNWDHPHVEGWMSVFRRWAQQDAFKRTWAASGSTYAERFRHFYADRLFTPKRRPLIFPDNFIIAHRGLWRNNQIDQNTLKAFRAAANATRKDKPDAVEFDVQRLKSGELVVFHDDAIGGRNLSDLTLADFIQALTTVAQQEHRDPTPLLTLSDCLRDLGGRMMKLDIEIKSQGAEADLLHELRDAAWSPEDLVVTSFHEDVLNNIHAIRADVQTGLLIEGAIDTTRIKKLRALAVDFVAPDVRTLYDPQGSLQEPLLNEFAKAGIVLVPWVENDAGRLKQLLDDPSIVGVITDRVDLAVKARRDIG